MSPLKLTDDELDQVFRAAQPLLPRDRDAFLRDVAERLARIPIGPGSVYKACAEAQRQFFDPPDFSTGCGVRAKYR
jgi:hypothetical protein